MFRLSIQHQKWTTCVLSCTAIICLFLFASPVYADNLRLSYNPTADLLSIDASDVPLKKLMNEISGQSGIKITVAEKADQPISITITDQPLKDALKKLARAYRLNHMFVHNTTKGQTELTQMKVLPGLNSSPVTNDRKTAQGKTATSATDTDSNNVQALEIVAKKRKLIEERKKAKRQAIDQRHQKHHGKIDKELAERESLEGLTPEERQQQLRKIHQKPSELSPFLPPQPGDHKTQESRTLYSPHPTEKPMGRDRM